MSKTIKRFLHVFIWLIYLFLVTAIMLAATQGEEMQPGDVSYYIVFTVGVAIVPAIISFYSHYNFLFSNYLRKRRIATSVLLSLVIAFVSAIIGFIVIYFGNTEARGCVQEGFPYAISGTTVIGVIAGAIAVILRGFLTWFEELKLKEELLEKTHRMELALAKAQLDPHFLFNTINNIDVLIEKDSAEASQYLKKLSDMLRFMLYQTKGETIPLKDELEYIEKYIALQKIRTGNKRYIQYEATGIANGQAIAPMVFIPFIENAFKHATNKKVDNAIDINVEINDIDIVFTCQNKYDQNIDTNGEHNGLGNALIQKRLNLLYPDTHILETRRTDDLYIVKLTIRNGSV